MSPIFDTISKIFDAFNNLLDGINPRIADAIKRGFFLFIFILMMIGAYFGYNMGHDAARIKSPPLIDLTNEVFDIDIGRQKTEGNFSEMLDSDLIHEGKKGEPDRVTYPAQQSIEPESDDGIIEAPTTAKRKMTPSIAADEPVFEGEYRAKKFQKGDVKEAGKDIRAMDSTAELITGDETKVKDPLSEETVLTPTPEKAGGKKTIRRIKSKGPQPILDDSGIIGK